MAIVDLDTIKAQLRIGDDDDDTLLTAKIAAAQDHLERLLGFKIADQYPTDVPAALVECVCELAAHWYENREAVLIDINAQPLPMGIADVVAEYRNYSWAG